MFFVSCTTKPQNLPLLYDIGIRAYSLALQAASPFHLKAKKWVKGRENLLAGIERKMQQETMPVAWFHCASLGEFEQGRPLIEAFKTNYPNWKICLTFFSPSGYEIRKNYALADYVFYLPEDTAANARAFITAVKPQLAIFVKYEFWHYYMAELHHRQIPVLSVSAIFRENQVYFKPYGAFNRDILRKFTHFFVQNPESEKMLRGIGITNVTIAGDTRFDRVSAVAKTAKSLPLAQAFSGSAGVMVIGSSWPQDMEHLLPFMAAQKELKFIIAPHEIKEPDILTIEQKFPGETARYTKTTETEVAGKRILIVDTIGLLSSLYQYGKFAFVGGAFGAGLHNTLEAATFGLPIFFGPNYGKFQEAHDLIALGAAFSVTSTTELSAAINKLFWSAKAYKLASAASRNYVAGHVGATNKIMKLVEHILPESTQNQKPGK